MYGAHSYCMITGVIFNERRIMRGGVERYPRDRIEFKTNLIIGLNYLSMAL